MRACEPGQLLPFTQAVHGSSSMARAAISTAPNQQMQHCTAPCFNRPPSGATATQLGEMLLRKPRFKSIIMLKLPTASAVPNFLLLEATFGFQKGLLTPRLLSMQAKGHLYLAGF